MKVKNLPWVITAFVVMTLVIGMLFGVTDSTSAAVVGASFPMWFQPNPGIGLILVHTSEELARLKQRDWTPQPLPGSDNPNRPSAAQMLAAERAGFEASKAEWLAEQEKLLKAERAEWLAEFEASKAERAEWLAEQEKLLKAADEASKVNKVSKVT